MKKNTLQNLTLSAMFVAVGLVLPFLTGQIPEIGKMLLPMHLPVLLCGLICGWKYGGVVGLILPIMRSFLFGMPVLFPSAIGMTFELAAYGTVIGLIYAKLPKKISSVYFSLGAAMIVGRIVWGIARAIMSGVSDNAFTWQLFISGAFLTAVPGIILQLIFIPAVMHVLSKSGRLDVNNNSTATNK